MATEGPQFDLGFGGIAAVDPQAILTPTPQHPNTVTPDLPVLLAIENLTKFYGRTRAIDNLSFSVAGGEIVGLLGPNGAGKTTALRCIATILQPTAGRITICGHDLATDELNAKRLLAYVPELPNPYEMLTVLEHLRFIAAAYDAEEQMAGAEALLQRFDLWEKRNELAASLSKGMRQKLAAACAFLHHARVYCFDEPMIGIDPKGARELKDMLAERRDAGNAVLVSTHQLDTAERLCDRVIILQHGQVVAEGTLSELHARARMASDATLEDLFLRLTGEDGE
jgi:ABC-2 type transport system ATP-binding protein